MKKLVLLSAVLFGAVSASQAGVRFNLGLGLPLPPLPGVVISRPAPYCAPAPPVYYGYNEPAVVVEPPSVYLGFGPGYYGRGYYGHRYPHYYGHRGWDHG